MKNKYSLILPCYNEYKNLKLLIPLIQKSSSPRIIFTTSGISKKAKAFWGPYAISKAGINALADILVDELESVSNIKIFNFHQLFLFNLKDSLMMYR